MTLHVKRLRIRLLKRRLRRAYRGATAWRGYMDCGHHIACHINPQILDYEREFNRLADQLAELDPTCPKVRFPE